jgi:chromosome segregation ATPase
LRIYAEPDDLTVSEIERAAIEKGITKKQLVLEAVDLYLHQDRSELDQAIKDCDQARSDADLRWKEANQIKSELNQAKRDLEAGRSREDQLRSEMDKIRSEKDQASSEAVGLHRDLEHYKETLAIKDKQIGFLEGHISQLTQSISQFALKPGDEEIKKKRLVAILEIGSHPSGQNSAGHSPLSLEPMSSLPAASKFSNSIIL